ncbi:MAG: hypothetical protein IT416_04020 [Candidatus Pacebacteria bacterium]|nr:hypothetical protein [Candidatus Paceibacterota bacterium]
MLFNQTAHQKKQLEVISQLELSLTKDKLDFTVVEPVADFVNDQRLALTSVHFPNQDFINKIQQTVIEPLRVIQPEHFYYSAEFMHMTVKNVKTINDPPLFDQRVITTTKQVFDQVVPQHQAFNAYYYRLLLFPYNLALIGTTDQELDELVSDLDTSLNQAGVPDNKKYLNDRYFFSNVTLARFNRPVNQEFRAKVAELSASFRPFSYRLDSLTLLTCNAVMNQRRDISTYQLK